MQPVETKQCKWMKSRVKRARKKYVLYPRIVIYIFTLAQLEEFYSPGSLELLESRRRIAEFSLPRSDFPWWTQVRCLPAFLHLYLAELKNGSLSSA